ncbi:MAG: LysR family transcriptional regulator [Sedimentitalea sp.]
MSLAPLTLKQLEALVWVADLGSFRKAAQHLNTTQPNVSARIAALETTLGLTLMQRSAAAVHLTPRGSEIVSAARNTLRAAEALLDVAGRADLVQNTLRLGVTELVAHTWLRAYLRDLGALYPHLTVDLTVDLSVSLDRALAGYQLDLTVQTAPFASRISGVHDIGSETFVWCGHPELAAKLPAVASLAELSRHTILSHARDTQASQELYLALKTLRLKPRIITSNSLLSCLHMAMDGMGLTLVPHSMAAAPHAQGSLSVIAADWLPKPLQFAARFHKSNASNYVIRAAKQAHSTARAHAT